MTATAPQPPALTERGLPWAEDAERAILGAILVEPSLVRVSGDLVRPAWFYPRAHRRIFEAILALDAEGRAIDFITVRHELERRGQLAEVGGQSYVTGLIDGIPRLANLAYYADLVREKAVLRGVIRVANKTLGDAMSGEYTAGDVLATSQRALRRIAEDAGGDEDDSAEAVACKLDALLAEPDRMQGIQTGFGRLDGLTQGMRAGDLWYLAAHTSAGKSALAYRVALNMAIGGHFVDLLSYEMSQEQVLMRLISSGWGVPLHELRSGRLTRETAARYLSAREWMRTAPLRIVSAAGMTTQGIRARANRLRASGELDAMVTDYIGLIPSEGRVSNRAQEVAAISRDLKLIALETGVPNLCLAQISREGAKTKGDPQLWWLKDSGGQEADADLVAMLVREPDASDAELHVLKQRNGPLGVVPLWFLKEYAGFEEAR